MSTRMFDVTLGGLQVQNCWHTSSALKGPVDPRADSQCAGDICQVLEGDLFGEMTTA